MGNWRQGPAAVEQAPVQGPQQPVGLTLPPHPLSNLALHQLPEPINWEGDILLLVLPHDDTPCILSTKVLQQVSREIPAECLQQSPPWKHALDAVCLADTLSTKLNQVSGPMVLSAKVKLVPGESATLHGHLKLPEVLNKRVNIIIEPAEDISTPPGLQVLSTKVL